MSRVSGWFLPLLIVIGLYACASGSADFHPTIAPSTPTLTPLATATATRTMIPTYTVVVPTVPNDKRIIAKIDSTGGHPVDVEVMEGSVWVSIQNPDFVPKIQP